MPGTDVVGLTPFFIPEKKHGDGDTEGGGEDGRRSMPDNKKRSCRVSTGMAVNSLQEPVHSLEGR